MNKTENFELSQWESTDRILMEDFNNDNAKLDAALGTQAASIAALTEQMAAKGNCQIYTTSYVGTGTCGASTPNTLTFPKRPLAMLVTSPYGLAAFIRGDAGYCVLSVNKMVRVTVNWGENTISWYDKESPNYQQNNNGALYFVVALMEC